MKKTSYIKTGVLSLAFYTAAAFGAVCTTAVMAHAETPRAVNAQTVAGGDFVQKSKRLKGSYEIIQSNGQTIIRFADNFRTKAGPDLKVFLSPQSIDTAAGSNATNGAVLLGFVKSTKGAQDYIVPEGVNLSDFNSVLIHCEAFSVLWGGGNI